MNKKIYTVTELNTSIKNLLEPDFADVWIEGEVSNYKLYPSGHAYFSLKDEGSQIPAVIFNFAANKFKLQDGMHVIARGRVTLYVKSGRHQIVITYIEPKGKGALQLAFEQLKAKLQKEGLFDEAHKKPLPMLPRKIGVVTSPAGAAIRDILTVLDRRFSNVHVLIYPVSVQGDSAKYEIAEAIKYLNENYPDIDVMLVGRGGGSYEDLWAFNEEIVARAIYGSAIPVISCVGHEIDFTIADFVADVRAPTPSAAAELVVKNKADLENKIRHYSAALSSSISHIVDIYSEKLSRISNDRYLRNPYEYFSEFAQELDDLSGRLLENMRKRTEEKEHAVEVLSHRLASFSPSAVINLMAVKLDGLSERLKKNMMSISSNREHILKSIAGVLNSLSPLNILSRGYSVVWKLPEKILLKNSKDVKLNDEIAVKLNTGSIAAIVKEKDINDI